MGERVEFGVLRVAWDVTFISNTEEQKGLEKSSSKVSSKTF